MPITLSCKKYVLNKVYLLPKQVSKCVTGKNLFTQHPIKHFTVPFK